MSKLIDCHLEQHGPAILDIFNHAIVTSTALYDYQPRTEKNMEAWFELKRAGKFPVIGTQSQAGELTGFATYGSFRPHAAYQFTVEHSVYVRHDFRGQGLGRTLLAAIIEQARTQNYHLMVGVIDTLNSSSIQLHRSLGFVHGGTLRQVGYKFDRWLDVDFYQLNLSNEPTPR